MEFSNLNGYDVKDKKVRENLTTIVKHFDTVSDMKISTNLINGSYAQTLGYYTINDGGSSLYKIRTKTNEDIVDEMTLIEIGSTLVAELVITDKINSKQFGIVGDGVTDESDKLKSFFSYNVNKYYINSENILIDDDIEVSSNSYIEFMEGCKITRKATDSTHYYMLLLDNVDNVSIINAHLVGDKNNHTGSDGEWGHGINIVCSTNILIDNCYIENTWGDGIYIGLYSTKNEYQNVENITIQNCNIDNCSRNGISVCSGKNILVENCKISNVNRTNPKSGIDIELEAPTGQIPSFENLVINNVYTKENGEGINVNCTSEYNAGIVKINEHHSYNENRGLYMSGFNNTNSTFIYENSYIELANTFAIVLNKHNNNNGFIKNIIVDSSKYNDLNPTYHGVIGLFNSDSENIVGGFTIDTVKVIKSHNDKYIWNTFLMYNGSNTGSIENITIKNISNNIFNNVGLKPLFFSPSAGTGIYDWSTFNIEQCIFERISNSPAVTLSGSEDGFNNLFTKSALWQNSTTTISPKLANGIYEISTLNKSTYSHIITFDSSYNVYTGNSSGNTSRTFTANYDGAYLKFRKSGSDIHIITNNGYTVS